MSDTNQITVRGRVGTDPDVLVTGNGKRMTKFRLGSTRGYRDAATGEWRETETEWFTVKTWGPAGDLVVQSVRRGMPVIVQGVFSCEEWESAERRHHTNVITATAIGVDIKYGLVTYAKVLRQAPAENGEATDGQPRPEADQVPDGSDATDEPGAGSEEDSETDLAAGLDPVLAPEPVDRDAWEKVGTV